MSRNNIIKRTLKTAISDIIVVFMFLAIVYLAVNILGEKYIGTVEAKINEFSKTPSINETNNETDVKIQMDSENNKIVEYPEYGKQYATVQIESIDLNLPLYYGDSLDILKKGIGQSTASYFPGEGGSIICMGHNFATMLRRFSDLKKGNIIKITTDYGEFNYKIYDMQIVKETEVDKVPLQHEEEILMIYTCYPFKNVGYTTRRYVVYAKPV